MRDSANILSIASLQPDYLGFIFYRHSKRFVGDDFEIPIDLPKTIERVGVFVDQPRLEILKIARKHKLDLIQLHGNESPKECKELRAEGIGVIKSFSITDQGDFDRILSFDGFVDYFLFDKRGRYPGGNGKVFDWRLLRRFDFGTPFFLSGGISFANVGDVLDLRDTNLYAIDINSGVEREPGLKDVHKTGQLFSHLDAIGLK